MATFTSKAEIIRLLGQNGFDACMDGLSPTNVSAFISDVINFATAEITSRTQNYYLDDEISANDQIRMNATVIACHFISERRGNAALWEGRIERIYEWLEKIRTGEVLLPGEEVIAPDVPVVRNHVVNFNSRQRILVDKERSTGTYEGEPIFPDEAYYPYP